MLKSFYKNNEKSINRIEGELKMLKIESNRKAGFTLIETLITVVILGIVAAILVPNLIKNQVENANRTKVKKAMASYEKAINYTIIENDIRETEALRELGQDNCQYTREYFKTVKDGSNNCIFKTTDKVWWDITDITNPLISLKDEITDSNKASIRANASIYDSDTTSFALVGRFDDLGTLRVNDNAYEQTYGTVTNQKYVAKLWFFITQSVSTLSSLDKCKLEGAATCIITSNGISTTYTKVTTNTDVNINHKCLYDRENEADNCDGHVSATTAGDYWISNSIGVQSTEDATSEETCNSSTYSNCLTEGDYYEAARIKCEKLGGRLATIAELKIASDNEMLPIGWYWAFEEYSSDRGYGFRYNGSFNSYSKTNTNTQSVCVAN